MVVNVHTTEVSREPGVHDLRITTPSHHHLRVRMIHVVSENLQAGGKRYREYGSNWSQKQRPHHQTHNHNNLLLTSSLSPSLDANATSRLAPSVPRSPATTRSSTIHHIVNVALTEGKAMATIIRATFERGSNRMRGIGTHTAIMGP